LALAAQFGGKAIEFPDVSVQKADFKIFLLNGLFSPDDYH
jgi:hypothetical protein